MSFSLKRCKLVILEERAYIYFTLKDVRFAEIWWNNCLFWLRSSLVIPAYHLNGSLKKKVSISFYISRFRGLNLIVWKILKQFWIKRDILTIFFSKKRRLCKQIWNRVWSHHQINNLLKKSNKKNRELHQQEDLQIKKTENREILCLKTLLSTPILPDPLWSSFLLLFVSFFCKQKQINPKKLKI